MVQCGTFGDSLGGVVDQDVLDVKGGAIVVIYNAFDRLLDLRHIRRTSYQNDLVESAGIVIEDSSDYVHCFFKQRVRDGVKLFLFNDAIN